MSNSQIDLAGAKILIVDDTPENLKLLRQAIEPEGYHILIATNGEGALKIAGSAHPDLILLDVQMPGLNGFETCTRLKADPNTQDIPVIFVTAEAETISVVEGFRTGGVDYIVKPFKNDEVIVRIRTHLKIDHLTRALDKSNQELSAANRQIREEAERKSRFLASMSHELRTPVNAIVGFARIVLRRAGALLPERQKGNLEKICESAECICQGIKSSSPGPLFHP
jgi:two-component system sensor histidine kinase/response regulator